MAKEKDTDSELLVDISALIGKAHKLDMLVAKAADYFDGVLRKLPPAPEHCDHEPPKDIDSALETLDAELENCYARVQNLIDRQQIS